MKCTCGLLESVVINRLPANAPGGTLKVVAYCCEKCGAILGVESDPFERDAQMKAIKDTAAKTGKLIEQIMVKLQARSAGGK